MSDTNLTQDELKRILKYDHETGVFAWRAVANKKRPGDIAGSTNGRGYRQIGIGGRDYSAHRLAWMYVHGVWPTEIDHINGVRDDNRLANLRVVTKNENQHNRPTAKGYSRYRRGWLARIVVNNVQHFLGTFTTENDARTAYLEAKKHYHPSAPIVA